MLRHLLYRFVILLCLTGVLLCGCRMREQKVMSKRVTLWKNDRNPYGTWYAYDKLKYVFPAAKVSVSRQSPNGFNKLFGGNEEEDKREGKKSALIIITEKVLPDEAELDAMLRMVNNGRQIFISAMQIGENLLDTFHLKTAFYNGGLNTNDSLTVSVSEPVNQDTRSYTYPGFSLYNYFTELDTTITTILGKDEEGRANFVKISYEGGGSIYLQVVPAAFTNFFLLHKHNKEYYDRALSWMPKNLELVSWDEYFRYSENGSGNGNNGSGKKGGFNAMGWIMGQPGLATATWILLILILIIILIESKRRQRLIPPIPAVKNASLDFVKTIGRLYFQRKDNKNLANKITSFFLDHVRTRYNIRAGLGDEDFAKRLSYKSGHDFESTKNLLYYMKYVQDDFEVSDESLLRLNQKLENFYTTTASAQAKKKQG